MSRRNQGHDNGQGPYPSPSKRTKLEHKDADGWATHHTAAGRTVSHDDYTVGWICALPLEMAAAKAMLDDVHADLPSRPNDHNAYTLGRIGVHNIVVACLPSGKYGTTSAAVAATQMQSSFGSIQFGLMVGIGGGVPGKNADIRLGDVVVSKPDKYFGGVVQYDYGKTVRGGSFERTSTLNKPPQVLLTAVTKLQADRMVDGSRIRSISQRWRLRVAPKCSTSRVVVNSKIDSFKLNMTTLDLGIHVMIVIPKN
jgi:nucleoside phosphorylase